jgi:hypothetical protein
MAEYKFPGKLTGGCHCGSVRYTITEPALDTHHCHCGICRKFHGALFVTLSIFNRKAFTYDKGGNNLGSFASSPNVTRHFCKTCGCPVTLDLTQKPELIAVATGTIDEGAFPGHPASTYRHAFVGSKVPWYEIKDDIRQVQGFDS